MRDEMQVFVIEGSDGTGKATQSKLLKRAFEDNIGVYTTLMSFPRYETFWGKMIRKYLSGGFGELAPEMAAVLYANDRWDAQYDIQMALSDEDGFLVIDRYVDSNKAHQAARVKDPDKRKQLMDWIDEMEYIHNKIIRPDFTFYLDVPVGFSTQMIEGRNKGLVTKDIHEEDENHRLTATDIYRELANACPANEGVKIECVRDGKMMLPEEVHEEIWKHIQRLIDEGRV